MEIKTYRTKNKKFPWTAEDSEGHKIEAVTKESAVNALKNVFHLLPKIAEDQRVVIPNEVKI